MQPPNGPRVIHGMSCLITDSIVLVAVFGIAITPILTVDKGSANCASDKTNAAASTHVLLQSMLTVQSKSKAKSVVKFHVPFTANSIRPSMPEALHRLTRVSASLRPHSGSWRLAPSAVSAATSTTLLVVGRRWRWSVGAKRTANPAMWSTYLLAG